MYNAFWSDHLFPPENPGGAIGHLILRPSRISKDMQSVNRKATTTKYVFSWTCLTSAA